MQDNKYFMMSLSRRRKTSVAYDVAPDYLEHKFEKHEGKVEERVVRKWRCVDRCCWVIGCMYCMWWFMLLLYNIMPASIPQIVAEAIGVPLPDPPGVKLRKEGLVAKHPVVFVPGIVTGGLELWEGRQCAEQLFRKRMWGGTFGGLYKR